MKTWRNLLINPETISNFTQQSWGSFWSRQLTKISNFIPSSVTNLKDWAIKLTPSGYSIHGFPINISSFPSNMQQYLRGLMCFLFFNQCSANNAAQSYYFKTMGSTIYKLWFSGLENMASTVISQLNNNVCNTTETNQIPNDMVLVENYYDHGGTVPMYAAVLTRDKSAIPNVGVENCVSDVIEMAHEAWNQHVNSGETIGITVGVILGVILCVAVASGTVLYCKTRRIEAEHEPLAKPANTV